MQFTGHAGRHLSHPLHSSGMITTSGPWLKIAPNWGGQARRHASQLMHSSISMRNGSLCHLGLRDRVAMRSDLAADMRPSVDLAGDLRAGRRIFGHTVIGAEHAAVHINTGCVIDHRKDHHHCARSTSQCARKYSVVDARA